MIGSSEKISINKVRRSAFIKKDINKGEKLNYSNIYFRRPGHGIGPDLFDQISNKFKSNKKLKKGSMLDLNDLSS